MPAFRYLFAAGPFIDSASALAQHHPVHKTSHAASFAEDAGGLDAHGVAKHHHDHQQEGLKQSHSAGASSIWTKCSEINSFDGWKPVDNERCLDANLILVRIQKTGTSSMAGVMRRIGSRYGLNGIGEKMADNMPEPLVSTDHFHMYQWDEQPFVRNIKNFSKPNIMMTLIRDPVERWLSDFYYRISKVRKECPCELLEFLQEFALKFPNYQAQYLLKDGYPEHKDGSVDVGAVLHDYPLVGITERFQESVIALMFLLGIDSFCDILFVDAKVSSTALNRQGHHFITHIPVDEQPDEIKHYIQSDEFQKSIASDKELYERANARLDHTIEKIGKKRFEARLSEYQKWLKQAQQTCAPDGDVKSMEEGCYYDDMGCRYDCLDQFCAAHGDALKVHKREPLFESDNLFKAPLITSEDGSTH